MEASSKGIFFDDFGLYPVYILMILDDLDDFDDCKKLTHIVGIALRWFWRDTDAMILGDLSRLWRYCRYSLVNIQKHDAKSPWLLGTLTISTGPFSIAMLNYQRVIG